MNAIEKDLEEIENFIRNVDNSLDPKSWQHWAGLKKSFFKLKKDWGLSEKNASGEHDFFIKIYVKKEFVGYYRNPHDIKRNSFYDFHDMRNAEMFKNKKLAIAVAQEYVNNFPAEKECGLHCLVRGVL